MGDGLRKYIEGESVLNANHIMYCGIITNTEVKVEIMALCLQTSDLYGMPHEVNLTILFVEKTKKIEIRCSCKGGITGQCKHSVALMLYLAR